MGASSSSSVGGGVETGVAVGRAGVGFGTPEGVEGPDGGIRVSFEEADDERERNTWRTLGDVATRPT